MLGEIGFVLGMVAVVVAVGRVSGLVKLPSAVLLTAAGLVYALLPGPNLELDPEVVLDLVLPPLLYNAALGSSLLAIRSRLRTVVSLSVLLVLATALAVGGLLAWLVPVVPLAAGIVLGAAVAPPDPVAALSVARRVGVPDRLATLIEGEGLLNDATALTTYQVASAVLLGAGFSLTSAVGTFALSAVGGVLVGAGTAGLVRLSRRVLTDPLLVNAVSLATPFAAYAAGEALHVSGVLAVVIAGLIVGHHNPRLQSGSSRLQTSAVWQLVNFLLEGFVFLLIGQQLPHVVEGLDQYSTSTVLTTVGVTLAAVLGLRPLWLVVTQHVPRRLHTRLGGEEDAAAPAEVPLGARDILALSWAGTRGVVTLVAAFAMPATIGGTPVPARDLLVFAAYVVVLVTLLGQGLTFAPLLRALGLRAHPSNQARLRNQARVAATDAALARLDQLAEEDGVPQHLLSGIRNGLSGRRQRYQARLDSLTEDPDGGRPADQATVIAARRAAIEAQHQELLRWRDAGRLPDRSLRVLQRELDHEERTLATERH